MTPDQTPAPTGPQPGQRADLLRRLRVWKLLVGAEHDLAALGRPPANDVDQLHDTAVVLLMAVTSAYWPRAFDNVDDAINFLVCLDA